MQQDTTTRHKYEEAFVKELSNLNTAQREAVDQIEGPVLVIAGPGTGKTQILSARIGQILLSPETQAAPHNILCLTYTDAGTIAMRNRLLQLIGPAAYRVHIYTFHAFCNTVIQENLDYFGFRSLQPITELETVNLYQQIVKELPAGHKLKRYTGDIYYECGRLKRLFEMMKKEGWTPEYLTKQADQFIASLPYNQDFIYKKGNKTGAKAGDLNTNKIAKETDSLEKLKAAVLLYNRYEELKKELRRYDYHDMIVWVINAFRDNENMLLNYQERYLYFLVDEYQDTNGSQNQILELLAGYWEKPNLFAVGDDDQSIFRFQGANVANIIDFRNKYEGQGLKKIVLTENYRSNQPILDAAMALIENNSERLVNVDRSLSKNLKAARIEEITAVPDVREYENVVQEEAGLVNALIQLHNDGEDLSDVAVIYRSHKLVDNIVKVLEAKNIPLNIRQRVDVLDLPLVNSFIDLLSYIEHEAAFPDSREEFIFRIIHFAFFGIPSQDAAKLAKACMRRKEGERIRWRELLDNESQIDKLGLHAPDRVKALGKNLNKWIADYSNHTIQVLFEKILTEGGVLKYVMNHKEKVWQMQIVSTFFDFIKDESARKPNFSVSDLITMVEQMKSNSITLPINKNLQSEKGINFITAHSSKGLQYKHVFLISCNARSWEKQQGNTRTYKLPGNLIDVDETESAEDERRLFYVAMTRAKDFLHLSYSLNDRNGKDLERSRFVSEILEKNPLPLKRGQLEEEMLLDYNFCLMSDNEQAKLKLPEDQFLRELLQGYTLSVTHLNKYLRCPLSFYFENLLQVPSARNASMGFGTAVHNALNLLFIKMLESDERMFPTVEQFIQFYTRYLKDVHSHFTENEFQLKLEYGKTLLTDYYSNYVHSWGTNVWTEFKIKNVEVDGVPINGVVDKLEFIGKQVHVTDYKTGKPENGIKKINRPDEKDPNGGDYWRQIVFYKILLDNYRRQELEMVSGEIDFIEKDSSNNFRKEKIVVTSDDIKIVKGQIKVVWDKINNLEFSEGCGEEDCTWCNFVKEQVTEVKPASRPASVKATKVKDQSQLGIF